MKNPKDEIFKDPARPESEWKSKKRTKSTGEVFSPPALINQMLDQVDITLYHPGKTFLEPAAGTGNMVIEYLKRKLKHGCTPIQALQDTYAIEYMLDNVEVMRKRVLDLVGDIEKHRQIVEKQIVHANFLDDQDTTDGRCYPCWLQETPSIEDFFS